MQRLNPAAGVAAHMRVPLRTTGGRAVKYMRRSGTTGLERGVELLGRRREHSVGGVGLTGQAALWRAQGLHTEAKQ
jgi:hypothetical protein